jgi:glycosyltransferase involved in cell wall biosynthesis
MLQEKPDIIYLNSMYSPYFTMLPLIVAKWSNINCKIIVAPRGMLSKGALNLKPLKKQLFLTASRMTGLFKNIIFHASSELEVEETKQVFGEGTRVFHAMNLTPQKELNKVKRIKETDQVKLVYLGRISEVKNLLQCISTLKKTSSQYHFSLDVYGPEENLDYLTMCKNEIATLPAHVSIQMKGGVDNAGINALLSNYHFLFLLTLNENFGHAIVEGFTAGCPAIISDRTPWRNLEEKKCGWDLPLNDNKKIIDTLHFAASMNQETYDIWSEAAYLFANSINENKNAIEDHIRMFES